MKKLPFIMDITHRDGSGSSKKLWYNLACMTATVVLLWCAWALPSDKGLEDWAFIWLFAIYLVTVGGFEVLLKMMTLVVAWKGGKPPEDKPQEHTIIVSSDPEKEEGNHGCRNYAPAE